MTDSTGRFRFENLAKGRYNIGASALFEGGMWAVFIPGIYLGESLDLGTDTIQTTGSLSVTVRSQSSGNLPGAHCYIVGGPWETVSNEVGTCLLIGLPPGRYKLLVTYPGLRSLVLEYVTVMPGSQTNIGSLQLMPNDTGTDTTWTERYKIEGDRISALAWSGTSTGLGNGVLVAVGSGTDIYGDGYGFVLTSPDGINWTKWEVDAGDELQEVLWAGNQFVAFGNRGSVFISTDDTAWTQRASVDTTWPLSSIAWSGTMLVASGWTYTAVSSDGGVSWTKFDEPEDLSSIVWSGTQFAAVGDGGI